MFVQKAMSQDGPLPVHWSAAESNIRAFLFSTRLAELSDLFSLWVIHSADDAVWFGEELVGGTDTAVGSQLSLNTSEEVFSSTTFISDAVSLTINCASCLCLMFLWVAGWLDGTVPGLGTYQLPLFQFLWFSFLFLLPLSPNCFRLLSLVLFRHYWLNLFHSREGQAACPRSLIHCLKSVVVHGGRGLLWLEHELVDLWVSSFDTVRFFNLSKSICLWTLRMLFMQDVSLDPPLERDLVSLA